MEFYHSVFGGELTLSTFEEFQAADDPSEKDKIMHGMLVAPEDMVLMGADTPNAMEYVPNAGVSISLSGDDDSKLRSYWERLSADGEIAMPLEAAPWGDSFGMCVDKYGVSWMVNIAGEQS
jgi:PhnB protein